MFLQPTVIPNVKMEECVFALENADVLLDLEEDIVTKVNEFMGARQFEYIKCINTRVCHDDSYSLLLVYFPALFICIHFTITQLEYYTQYSAVAHVLPHLFV